MMINETIWERFRNHTATQADLEAIWQDNEEEHTANPALKRCPDFEAFMIPLLWQIARMDWRDDGSEPTMGDAMEVLAMAASEGNA